MPFLPITIRGAGDQSLTGNIKKKSLNINNLPLAVSFTMSFVSG